MRTWFSVQNAAGSTAEISIFDEIGMWGVTAKEYLAEFKKITAKDVTLLINSPGGSVFDAVAMFNGMKMSGKNITVRILGIAASAASYVALVGDRILMPANSFMMVHNPIWSCYGNADDMRETAGILDKLGASLETVYIQRSGKPEAEIRELLSKDTFLTAAECLEHGFADEVLPAMDVKAKFELDRLPENVKAIFKASIAPPKADDKPAGAPDNTAEGNPAPDTDKPEVDPAQGEPQALSADIIQAMADKAGVGSYASVWALDEKLATTEAVAALIAEAKETVALCAIAKQPEKAGKFIRAHTPLKDVRAKLQNAAAAKDEATAIDTAARVGQEGQRLAAAIPDPQAIYAARKNRINAQQRSI